MQPSEIAAIKGTHQRYPSKVPTTDITRSPAPPRPVLLPENVPKLESFIRNQFASSAFNRLSPFPSMSTTPAHIHLKPDATPYARNSPIPVPHHWKDTIKLDSIGTLRGALLSQCQLDHPLNGAVQWSSLQIRVARHDERSTFSI